MGEGQAREGESFSAQRGKGAVQNNPAALGRKEGGVVARLLAQHKGQNRRAGNGGSSTNPPAAGKKRTAHPPTPLPCTAAAGQRSDPSLALQTGAGARKGRRVEAGGQRGWVF